jgi:hypothetical protein
MPAHDRYALAIALLEGDRQARKILADLLEEQGERGLAQWARKGRNQPHRRLDLTVMLLPCHLAIGLAAELLKESTFQRQSQEAFNVVAAIHQWARHALPGREAHGRCIRALEAWRQKRSNPWVRVDSREATIVGSGADTIVEALRCAVAAAEARISGFPALALEIEAYRHVRQMVKLTARQSFPPVMAPDGSMRYLSPIEWQIERTKGLLQYLLNSQDDVWPR